jgi:putative hemolysin
MNAALSVALLILLGALALVSYVERIYTEAGKFLSREFQENIEAFEHTVEPRLHVSRDRAALSMAVLEQLITAAIAFLIAYGVFSRDAWRAEEILQGAAEIVVLIIVFNSVGAYILFSRTRGEWVWHLT